MVGTGHASLKRCIHSGIAFDRAVRTKVDVVPHLELDAAVDLELLVPLFYPNIERTGWSQSGCAAVDYTPLI
ncbi:hypothetical protein EJB05_23647, partial [Eragrostis curvula]